MDTEEDDCGFLNIWAAQDTAGNVWFLKLYSQTEDVAFMLGTDFKSMMMPAEPKVGDPMGIIVPETETNYCRCVAVNISLHTNFGSYDNCFESRCFHKSKSEVAYYCPGIGMVRSSTLESPGNVKDLKVYGVATDATAATVKQVVVIPLGD